MKEVLVLGSGCSKCVKTAQFIQKVADECDVSVNILKESSPEVMMRYGVMRTPAIVVDKSLVHSGSIPDRSRVEAWLK